MAMNIGDEYIDMEVNTSTNFLCNYSPQRDFEFQLMSTNSLQKDTITSPADELFYKGKLLPLHLPPRIQMVEKLLENSNPDFDHVVNEFGEFYSTPLIGTTPTAMSTPFESCNISPSESCVVSRELIAEEYFAECSNEGSGFIGENQKKVWTRKLKLIKQYSIGSKLKASGAYLKALFSRSGCTDDYRTTAAKVADEGTATKAKESIEKSLETTRKLSFGQIQKDKYQATESFAIKNVKCKQNIDENGSNKLHRRSFSMALRRSSTKLFSPTSSSLSSSSSSSTSSTTTTSSSNSNGFRDMPFLKRSNSVNWETENPIQGAIAHCKQSQKQSHPMKNGLNEIGFCSLSASKLGDQVRLELCRG